MNLDLADIRARTNLTPDGRIRLTLEYPATDNFRRRAMTALSDFLRPEPPQPEPPETAPVEEAAA